MGICTFILGLIGTILGILNLFRAFRQDQVRLKIIPEFIPSNVMVEGVRMEKEIFHITVVNLSNFPVTINEVGVVARKQRCPALCSSMIKKVTVPFRLESRDPLQLQLWNIKFPDGIGIQDITAVYAETACGASQKGRNSAIDRFKKEDLAVPRLTDL
jgi:hypothetical protein